MTKNRLEAFSDGVLAIILTIMVLELKVPVKGDPASFHHLGVQFASYLLSFAFIAIYWNNHHHMLHAAQRVTGRILWLNTLLLFSLSLVPFGAAWLGEWTMASLPVMLYGLILLAAGFCYFLLAHSLAALHGPDSLLARALGADRKGKITQAIYVLGIAVAYWLPWLSFALYGSTALIWLVPDRRIEDLVEAEERKAAKRRRTRR